MHGSCTGPSSIATRLVVRGAVIRGLSHAQCGEDGQDVIGATWASETGTLYVAVADGLGSLSHSARVASHAVRAALHLCATLPDGAEFGSFGPRMFETIVKGLTRDFGGVGGGTTLVVAELVPTANGATVTVHGVGDSEAWALADGTWRPLHHERDLSPVDDNLTREVAADMPPRTLTRDIPVGGMVVLATDGWSAQLVPETGRGMREWAGRWRSAPAPMDFASQVCDLGDDLSDDRGVIGVWVE
jgi:hypothetical protein